MCTLFKHKGLKIGVTNMDHIKNNHGNPKLHDSSLSSYIAIRIDKGTYTFLVT